MPGNRSVRLYTISTATTVVVQTKEVGMMERRPQVQQKNQVTGESPNCNAVKTHWFARMNHSSGPTRLVLLARSIGQSQLSLFYRDRSRNLSTCCRPSTCERFWNSPCQKTLTENKNPLDSGEIQRARGAQVSTPKGSKPNATSKPETRLPNREPSSANQGSDRGTG